MKKQSLSVQRFGPVPPELRIPGKIFLSFAHYIFVEKKFFRIGCLRLEQKRFDQTQGRLRQGLPDLRGHAECLDSPGNQFDTHLEEVQLLGTDNDTVCLHEALQKKSALLVANNAPEKIGKKCRWPWVALLIPLLCTGCAVVAVADAAVSVAATTVKVGAKVVETAVDVTAAGVKAVVGKDEEKEKP
jgi:hypothetical protein